MDQNQTTDNDDLQKAIDEITKTTSKDPVFSDPVPAPSTIPEGDNGMINDQVGPFPDLEAQFDSPTQNPIEGPENPNPFTSASSPTPPTTTTDFSLPPQQPSSIDFSTPQIPSMDPSTPETPASSTDFSSTQALPVDSTMPGTPVPSTDFSTIQMPTPSTEDLSSTSNPATIEMPDQSSDSSTTELQTDSVMSEPSTNSTALDPVAMDESLSPTPTPSNTTYSNSTQIKAAALQDLAPLIDKLTLEPSQKFHLYQDIIKNSNDETLLEAAYQSAREIRDETERAEALLYIIESIE